MAKVGMKGSKEGERKIKFKKKVPKKVKTQESIEHLKSQYGEINSKTVKSFQDLPLSKETLAGLKAGKTHCQDECRSLSGGVPKNLTLHWMKIFFLFFLPS